MSFKLGPIFSEMQLFTKLLFAYLISQLPRSEETENAVSVFELNCHLLPI